MSSILLEVLSNDVSNEVTEIQEPTKEVFSYSRLNSFDEDNGCMYAWFITYRMKNRGLGNGFSDWGTAYHELFKDFLDGKVFQFEMADKYVERVRKIKTDFPRGRYDFKGEYLKKILSHIETFHYFKDYEILEYEAKHELEIEGIPFVMLPDMVAYDPKGKLTIIDHKISNQWERRDLTNKKKQLYTYAYGIEKKYGEFPKQFQVNFFKINKIMTYPFVMSEYEDTIDWIKSTVEKIQNSDKYPPRCLKEDMEDDFYANHLCNHRSYCEYKNVVRCKT